MNAPTISEVNKSGCKLPTSHQQKMVVLQSQHTESNTSCKASDNGWKPVLPTNLNCSSSVSSKKDQYISSVSPLKTKPAPVRTEKNLTPSPPKTLLLPLFLQP